MSSVHKVQTNFEDFLTELESPILIVSSAVGAGNISVGEALAERIVKQDVKHVQIEQYLPASAVNEDNIRYKFLSDKLTFLLHLVYRIPFFYRRKFIREKYMHLTDLSVLAKEVEEGGYCTVIAISHRQAFWLSFLKNRKKSRFKLYGVLTEFGTNLGWRYLLWSELDGFLSPMPKKELDLPALNENNFIKTPLLYRKEYNNLASIHGSRNNVLFVAGFWGQISINKSLRIVNFLLEEFDQLHLTVVCGTNKKLLRVFTRSLGNHKRISLLGTTGSLANIMLQCAGVITKPGFSTLIEAYGANRQIFLLPGMPVAEEHNAEYAIKYFNAKRFSLSEFRKWYLSKQAEA